MVVDGAGSAHVAAVLGEAIWYLTDATGTWTRHRVSEPPSHKQDDSPAIALDPTDGSLWIMFSRRSTETAPNFSEGGYIATNASGSWSDPMLVADVAESPVLAAHSGRVFFGYDDHEVANAEDLGDYVRPVVVEGIGGTPIPIADIGHVVAISAVNTESARVLFASWSSGHSANSRVFTTTLSPAGTSAPQRAPSSIAGDIDRGGYSSSGDPFINWAGDDSSSFSFVRDGTWTDPQSLVGELLAVDQSGIGHGLQIERPSEDVSGGISYWQNDGNSFLLSVRLMDIEGRNGWALALDGGLRPHVLISTESGTWYAVGPSR